jgi:hypothetical protein
VLWLILAFFQRGGADGVVGAEFMGEGVRL